MLRGLGWSYGARAVAIGLSVGVVIAVPTRLLETGWFSRMTPVRPQDYVFLILTSLLTGMIMALPRRPTGACVVGSSLATVLAVGCPVCNKLVVMLLGVSGAMTWFAPLQPILGAGAVILLVGVLRQRLTQLASVQPLRASGRDVATDQP